MPSKLTVAEPPRRVLVAVLHLIGFDQRTTERAYKVTCEAEVSAQARYLVETHQCRACWWEAPRPLM